MRLIGFIAALLCLLPVAALDASVDYRGAEDSVRGYFRDLEIALNNHSTPLDKMYILHDGIRADAVFDVRVDRSALDGGFAAASHVPQVMRLNKDAYINSFLLSGHKVRDYRADVHVVSIEAGIHGGLVSTILLNEHGTLAGVYQKRQGSGQAFVSYTVCKSQHGRDLQILSSACDTQVRYQRNI